MRKSFKYRLYPTQEQQAKIQFTLERCRLLYNRLLEERILTYKETGKTLNYYEQANSFNERKQYIPSLKQVHSQVLQDVAKRLDKAFQAFFRRVKAGEKPGFPRFKPKARDRFLIPKRKQLIHHGHPCPQLRSKAKEYHDQMVEIMQAYWKQLELNENDRFMAGGYELHKGYLPFLRVAEIEEQGDHVKVTIGSPDPQELFMRFTRNFANETALNRGFLVPVGREEGARTFTQGNECLRTFYYRRCK